jgi:hypothetical protein
MVNSMTDQEEQKILADACDASGIAVEDLQEYRITADSVRLVAKDGRKWVVEIVRLNPEATSPLTEAGRTGGGRDPDAGATRRPARRPRRPANADGVHG